MRLWGSIPHPLNPIERKMKRKTKGKIKMKVLGLDLETPSRVDQNKGLSKGFFIGFPFLIPY